MIGKAWKHMVSEAFSARREAVVFGAYEEELQFRVVTRYGSENVENYKKLQEKLDDLQKEKYGFVRLEMNPLIDGKRYLETIYDEKTKSFYLCILEDRPEGQGFWECILEKPGKSFFRSLFKNHKFGLWFGLYFKKKPTGIQRRVVAEGFEEYLYMTPYEMKSAMFDEKGLYGASQELPRKVAADSEEGKRLRQVIKKHFPTYNEEQMKALLEKLASEACAYVSPMNILMSHFVDRPAEFEEKFGFPLYGANGELNYNHMLVDFYSAVDNHYAHQGEDRIDFEEDRQGDEKNQQDYNYSMDVTGKGVSMESRVYRVQLYLKDKRIKLNIRNHILMGPGIFLELAKKGYVVLDLYNGNVRYEDGSLNQFVPAHSMLITGVTADCRYIVSTWGKKLYVNPNEEMGKDGKPARFDYQYYEFG